MVQPMLFLHWKQVRLALLPLVLAAYGLPLFAVQGLGAAPGMDHASLDAYRVVSTYQAWLPFFPILAGVIGVVLGLSAWNWDHQLKHVYALSLPIPRWRYAALKMGAGSALALIPAAAFWVGAHVAAASISLPPGLHAYPNEIALRFLAAILVSYSLLFAMAAGTTRTALWVLLAWVGFLIAGNLVAELVFPLFPALTGANPVEAVFDWLVSAPGPFEVFAGNWTLIDV